MNVLEFLVWLLIVLRVFLGLAADKSILAKHPRPAGFTTYHVITEFVAVAAMAWLGYFWTAGVYTFASLLFEGARNKEPKNTKETT